MPNTDSQVHIFGIRHHGPGSARSLRDALGSLEPDCILVEGPPDADHVLPLMAHTDMQPPVALLIYRPDQPRRAVYYPFAVFSPEWQAIAYGLEGGVPVRFMDLPQTHSLAEPLPVAGEAADEAEQPALPAEEMPPESGPADNGEETEDRETTLPSDPREDPLGWLAKAAGHSDGERWWESLVEQRQGSEDLFSAILEAMTALREALPEADGPREALRESLREAHMRKTIRTAQNDGCKKIAVVCGAWHAPALAGTLKELPTEKSDNTLLKGLPQVEVKATWVPWTYGRLSFYSGYGAGVHSPGWYHHLWTTREHVAISWMAQVAKLLREQDLDASSAHIIEAVRMAKALASLRERPAIGLTELNEATRAVLLFGDGTPMSLIHSKLIVGETLGSVPPETPTVPLQVDLEKQQKRLRLPVEATPRTLDLDLRGETDLHRSHLLHRLSLLGVPWGQIGRVGGGKKGTFHELWTLQWQPELAVSLIEAGMWGNTIADAATGSMQHLATRAKTLPELTRLLDSALLADLADAIAGLMSQLEETATLSSDVGHLMEALPPLANVLRYGNVRRMDTGTVAHVVSGIVARICIGLPGAVASLNDEAASEMFARLPATNDAVGLLNSEEHSESWCVVLQQLVNQRGVHGLIAGRACRILLDAAYMGQEDAARHVGLALSTATEPAQAAAWVEGFLMGSGLVLLHDKVLLATVDSWVAGLRSEAFIQLLPLLRRTFSTFSAPERRQIGEWVRRGPVALPGATAEESIFDPQLADAALPLLAQLLGLRLPVSPVSTGE